MKKIENLLKKQELARGTPDFDSRMDGLFRRPLTGSVRLIHRPIALWQAIALSILALVAGYWMRPPAADSPSPELTEKVSTIYVYTQEARDMENMFGVADERSRLFSPMSASMVTIRVSDRVESADETDNI